MDYKFVKVQSKDTLDNKKSKYYWLFCPRDEKQVLEHWKKYVCSVISEGTKNLVHKMFHGYKGHCTNDFEQAVESLSFATNDNIQYTMIRVENEALKTRIESIRAHMPIFLTKGLQVVLIDERFSEIVETKYCDVLTFPDEDKPTIDDVRFITWEGGYHIYAKVGKLDVVDKRGNQKWNTRQEAEDAARWYIAKNW